MLKEEFLDGLRRALSGNVEVEVINETIRYYEDYIDIQIKKGTSEATVMEQLGKPQLIAKSILDANANRYQSEYSESANKIYEEGAERYSRSKMGHKGVQLIANMPQWLAIFLALFILFLFIGVIGSVLSFLAPVLIPVGIILAVITFFKNRK